MTAGAPAVTGRRPAVTDAILEGGALLAARGVEDGRLDAEHLLGHVLGVPRLQLYLDPCRPLGPRERERYRRLLRRRGAREPLQYIVGSAPFRDLDLRVDRRVAIPRPETEYMLDVLTELVRRDRDDGTGAVFAAALDIGTGSGAIAISLASEGLARSVTATDVSPAALAVAAGNASRAGALEIEFLAGPSLEPVRRRTFDLILANPPYLAHSEWLRAQPEVRDWEPRIAMHGGEDGLDAIRSVAEGLESALRPGGWLGLEVGSGQTGAVAELLGGNPALSAVVARDDLTGRGRYVFARRAHDVASP